MVDHQLQNISSLMPILFILITCVLAEMVTPYGEIRLWPLLRLKGLKLLSDILNCIIQWKAIDSEYSIFLRYCLYDIYFRMQA